MQADRQTDAQTDMLIATVRTPPGGGNITYHKYYTGLLPLSREKKIPDFSRRNCRQHTEQMYIY